MISPVAGWTTIGVTAMPPGWFNVSELTGLDAWTADGGVDPVFRVDPCPALLFEERVVDGERETRIVAAKFKGARLRPVGSDHYGTLTADEWEQVRPDAEQEVTRSRVSRRRWMLAEIAEAGEKGMPAKEMRSAKDSARNRALDVRRQLVRDGLVVATWERDDDAPAGVTEV